MTQESSTIGCQLWESNIEISSTSPPEEILTSVTGGFGFWQISIVALGFIAHFISQLEVLTMKLSLPSDLNFTCADGNGSRCVTANGSACTDFVFFKISNNVQSFTEKLKLVCELGNYPEWMRDCYRSGLSIGFVLAGVLVDRFGQKLTAIIFISLHCLTGILVIGMSNVALLFMFVLTHSCFKVILTMVSVLAVCESVGNKWRTFALGLWHLPRSIAATVVPYYYQLFSNSYGAIAITSLMPLVLLIPLQYFHDSPNHICLVEEFDKSEKALCEIARWSGTPIPATTRLRPVQIVLGSNIPKRTTLVNILKHYKIRETFLALFIFWLFLGYTDSVLKYYAYPDVSYFSLFGVCELVGCVTSLTLCHCFSQKVVLGIFEFSKCLNIVGILTCTLYWEDFTNTPSFVILRYTSGFFYVVSISTAMIITPRMFPTELRGISVGICGSMYHFAYVIARLLRHWSNDNIYVTGSFLIISLIFEISACFWFWEVHNRELPDFLIDCIKFRKYYKPTRFLMIYDRNQQDEIEIQAMNFSQEEMQ